MARTKNQPADQQEPASDEQASANAAEAARIIEAKRIGVELQRAALRLNELGCAVSGARVLDAAVRLSKLKPGRVA